MKWRIEEVHLFFQNAGPEFEDIAQAMLDMKIDGKKLCEYTAESILSAVKSHIGKGTDLKKHQ